MFKVIFLFFLFSMNSYSQEGHFEQPTQIDEYEMERIKMEQEDRAREAEAMQDMEAPRDEYPDIPVDYSNE